MVSMNYIFTFYTILLFWNFTNAAAYHLGKYEPSSPPTKGLHVDKKKGIWWMSPMKIVHKSDRFSYPGHFNGVDDNDYHKARQLSIQEDR